MTKLACEVTIFGQRSIHASVEWLGTPVPFYDTTGVWNDNILVPELRWVDGRYYETCALQTQSGVRFRVRSVPWRGAIPFCAAYLSRSPLNTRATVCRVRDVRLRANCLAQSQTLSFAHHTSSDDQGNWSDDDLDGWVDQNKLLKFRW